MKISGTAPGVKEIGLTGRLGASIGLIIGLHFFVVRGVADSLCPVGHRLHSTAHRGKIPG
ncbi:MAG TPA: hypothetical protein VFI80_00195 [Burkholderiales bacterium]|nr:hypothetical protein [Burkholderiales bacterium]